MAFHMTENLQTGLGALTAFSSVLQEVLGNIDGKVGDLSFSLDDIVVQLSKLNQELAAQDQRLKTVEALSDDNKSVVQAALTTFQSDIEDKLEGASQSFHKEIVSQRALNKMDLNALRGKMTHSVSEAVNMLQDAPRLYTPSEDAAPPSSQTVASIDFLMDRVKKMEEAIQMQHTMNTHFNSMLNSDEMVQKVYDSLYDQIRDLTDKQTGFKTENAQLKQQLREIKTLQREHERVIAELHQALVNEQRMEQLRNKISDRKAFTSSTGSAKPAKSEPMRRAPNTDMMNEELIYGAQPKSSLPALSTPAPDDSAASADGTSPVDDATPEPASTVTGPASAAHPQPRVTNNTSGPTGATGAVRSPSKSKSHRPAVPSAIAEEVDGTNRDRPARRRSPTENTPDADDEMIEQSLPVVSAPAGAVVALRPRLVHATSDGVIPLDEDIAEQEGPSSTRADERESRRNEKGQDEPFDPTDEHEADGGYDYGEYEAEEELRGHLSPSSSVIEAGSIFSENNSVTDYYYGSDYTRKIVGGLEARHRHTQDELDGLRAQLDNRLEELEGSVTIFKRLALVIDDLKVGYDSMRAKIEAVTGQESIDEKLAQSIYAKLKHSKEMWSRVHSEMVFGLDNIPDAEKDFLKKDRDRKDADQQHLTAAQLEAQRRDAEQKRFFKLSLELVGVLDDSLEQFAPRESLSVTLKYIFPMLSQLYDQAEVLVAMDTKARQSNSLDYCFDDIICSDLSTSLKGYVNEALLSSVPVLDECLHSWHIYKLLLRCQGDVDRKADKIQLEKTDHEVRHALGTKVDHAEFVAVTSRLASTTEVQRLQAQITERLSSAGGTGTHGMSLYMQSGGGGGSGDVPTQIALRDQPEYAELTERFTALAYKVVDLQQLQTGLVGKEEVHEALRAVIGEVKSLRRNCVTAQVFKEGLRLKADAFELERLVKQMTAALGNINLTDFANSSAAVHAKCLICDKPVSQQRARSPDPGAATAAAATNGRDGSALMPAVSGTSVAMSRSLPALYDKGTDRHEKAPKRPNVVAKLANAQERAKVASELNILRTSVALPELSDSVEGSPYAGTAAAAGASAAAHGGLFKDPAIASAAPSYRNRIRASAGGGMGPSVMTDTR